MHCYTIMYDSIGASEPEVNEPELEGWKLKKLRPGVERGGERLELGGEGAGGVQSR